MKIVIEAQRVFRRNKHGMDFVALETVRNLQRIDTENQYWVLVSPGPDQCLQSTENCRIVELKCPTYPLWEQIALPAAIRRIKPDIVHCTSNTAPLWCPAPLVVTLHDIIYLEKRNAASASLYQNLGWHYRRMVVPRILPRCRRIITVSNFERGRIVDKLRLDPDRVAVIYNGFGRHFQPVADPYPVTSKYLKEPEYLFFLGNTDPKKNTLGTLKAYSAYLRDSARKLPLLVADLDEEQVSRLARDTGLEEILPYLRYSGYIPNDELPYIYSGAFAFLYTSLRESFGIPLLEAMACGTPVVTSNTSSMPEIAGEGAFTADPTDPEKIAGRILDLEHNSELYDEQRAYGLTRAERFDWTHTAAETLKLYETVYAETNDKRGGK